MFFLFKPMPEFIMPPSQIFLFWEIKIIVIENKDNIGNDPHIVPLFNALSCYLHH